MQKDLNQNINFPLDSFLHRLELAGFYISPAERLRVLRVLEGFGKSNLQSPEKLKFLLCPIIAQGKADQAKFYELFDQYWSQVMEPWESEEAETASQANLDWLRWLIVVLAVAGLVYAGFKLQQTTPDPMVAHFTHLNEIEVGKAIRFENNSSNVDSLCRFSWAVFDAKTGELEYANSDSFHLEYLINEVGESPFKRIKLTSYNPTNGDSAFFESQFVVVCGVRPVLDGLEAKTSAKPNEPLSFSAVFVDTAGLVVKWEMGEWGKDATADSKDGMSVQHSYEQEGLYTIRLSAMKEGAVGFCQMDTVFNVKIGGKNAYLTAKTLYEDKISSIVNFSIGMWVLMGLVGIGLLLFWLKWAGRKAPLPDYEMDGIDMAAAAKRFKSDDRAPYRIPFRSNGAQVRADRELYRLADVMRQRQEGLRKEMDVPTSLKRTIAEGGFPQLLTKADSVPTEYLFLIEELPEMSHQRHLNSWIVDFLREREVLGEVFFFKNDLQRFWNSQYPNGISPEQLKRLHAWHKLVVLSDGHGLIQSSPDFINQRPTLHTPAKKLFSNWKQRLLVTPVPVVSWTYREGALHDLFAIFPMDTDGLTSLLKYIEHDVLDEERPPYATWSSRLLENRAESDINYRKWHTAAEHQDYLWEHPSLYTWLSALSVYPTPNWDLTLAIGNALSEFGVDVTYDNLLILCRIPWLNSGGPSPRLRAEFLDSLDYEIEQIAREAVERELNAVHEIVKDGHANLEHQVNLVLTQFSLSPEAPDNQLAMRQLMALDLLTPRHFTEINQNLGRHLFGGQSMAKKMAKSMYKGGSMNVEQTSSNFNQPQVALDRDPELLKGFVNEHKPPPEPLPKPFFTPDFWWAVALSWVFILLFTLGWNLGGTEQLAHLAGVDTSDAVDCQEEFLFAYILKKECIADSAIFLNNQAVRIFKNMNKDATPATQNLLREVNKLSLEKADSLFSRAMSIRPNYDLPRVNRDKLFFNRGMQEYHAYLADSSDLQGLQKSLGFFQKVLLDSLLLDAIHGQGLSYFYMEKDFGYLHENIKDRELYDVIQGTRLGEPQEPDSSLLLYEFMLTLDAGYFDTLSTYPHLQSLLSNDETVEPFQQEVFVKDADTQAPLVRVLVSWEGVKVRTDAKGRVTMAMRPGERRQVSFSVNGYESRTTEIRAAANRAPVEIVMVKTPVESAFKLFFELVDASRNPIRGARIRLVWSATGEDALVLESDDRGRVDIESDDASFGRLRLDLVIEKDGYTTYRQSLAKTRQEAQRNGGRISLQKENGVSQSYSATVVDANDQPLSGIEIKAIGLDITTTSDINGNFTINIPGDTQVKGFEVDNREQVFDRRSIIRLDYYARPTQQGPPPTGRKSGFEMVQVKGGTYTMGSPKNETDRQDDECQHPVTVGDFQIGKYEVTQADWREVMGDPRNCDECPESDVSWIDVQEFIKKASDKYGIKYRLPTEEEWEYAARGGHKSRADFLYAGSNTIGEVAWSSSNSDNKTHPVGGKKANELGLYDMSGNVWEWCTDKWGPYFNCTASDCSTCRVVRGGSWGNDDGNCRVAERGLYDPDYRYYLIGFRLARN